MDGEVLIFANADSKLVDSTLSGFLRGISVKRNENGVSKNVRDQSQTLDTQEQTTAIHKYHSPSTGPPMEKQLSFRLLGCTDEEQRHTL